MDDKISFIMSAINDAQATIRATDVKVGALLTGLLLPTSYIVPIWDYALSDYTPRLLLVLISILSALWGMSISILVKTISAVGNPANNISGAACSNGSFYGGELYEFTFKNALLNSKENKSSMSIQEFYNAYPSNQTDICLALSFEHMKLIFIRDIKLYRLDLALKVTIAFLLLGIDIYVLYKSI